jgi:hypothetical protein
MTMQRVSLLAPEQARSLPRPGGAGQGEAVLPRPGGAGTPAAAKASRGASGARPGRGCGWVTTTRPGRSSSPHPLYPAAPFPAAPGWLAAAASRILFAPAASNRGASPGPAWAPGAAPPPF